jgi:hypothetical protein
VFNAVLQLGNRCSLATSLAVAFGAGVKTREIGTRREIVALCEARVAKALRRAQTGASLCGILARGAENRRDWGIEARRVVAVVMRSATGSVEANVAGDYRNDEKQALCIQSRACHS